MDGGFLCHYEGNSHYLKSVEVFCDSQSQGGHSNVNRVYQARPKIHVKRVFFHNRALYVRNVSRVSN